jgi:Flp pilus assembly protein TadD
MFARGTAAALAGVVYLNAVHNPFVYDDFLSVADNPSIRHLSDIRRIVLHGVTRPFVNLSYAIDHALWGGEPFGFHVTNILLHILNVVLLFAVAVRFCEDSRRRRAPSGGGDPVVPAFVAAVLFAVHPMMTEAVGYISGRSEVLCATFFLGGLLAARRWMLCRGARWWVLALVLWDAAIATKEIAVVFPVVLFFYDRLLVGGSREERQWRLARLHAPLVALAAAIGLVRLAVISWVEHPGGAVVHWRYGLMELDVIRRYFTMILVPSGQSIFHEVADISGLSDPRGWIAILAVGSMLAVAWSLRRSLGIVSLGILWFLLVLVPSGVLVLVDLGEPMAEHRVYVASCGLFLALGAVASRLLEQAQGADTRLRAMRAGAVAGVLALAGLTMVRNAVWADSVSLWTEAASQSPEHWRPHLLLGEALHDAGRREEAVAEYRKGLALRPVEQWGYMKLGLCLAELGRLEEAAATFEQLRRLDPRSEVALSGLGAVAMLAGDADGARSYFVETINNHPGSVAALRSLATLEETLGRNPAEALRRCEELERLAPGARDTEDCIRRNRSRVGPPDAERR